MYKSRKGLGYVIRVYKKKNFYLYIKVFFMFGNLGLNVKKDKTFTSSDSIEDRLAQFLKMVGTMFFFVFILSCNILAVSIALNDKSSQIPKPLIIIFCFLFGLIYLVVNFYMFKLKPGGEIIRMDKKTLFPT
jgi:hypothetical protein